MLDTAAESGAHHLLSWARKAPQAIAVVDVKAASLFNGQTSFTYADTAAHLANLVAALDAEAVRPGVTIGVECRSRYLRTLLVLACEVLGAVHASFVAAQLVTTNSTVRRCQVFLTEHSAEPLRAIGRVVTIDGAFVSRLLRPAGDAALARLATSHSPDTGVRLTNTSGTTGAPKHMLKTRQIINSAVDGYDSALWPVVGKFTYLCIYDPVVGGVYTDVIRALKFGNKIWFASGLSEFAAAARAERCYAFLLPAAAEQLVGACSKASVKLDLYYVDITGSGVSPELEAAIKLWVSPRVGNVYSSNEASLIASRRSANRYAIVPGVEVRIVDDEWLPMPAGETGRICVRSPLVVDGYLWDEALTAQHFRDRWFLMSDLGFMPDPESLVVLGRTDDMLNIGGVKIAPYPIEQTLRSMPGVADAVLLRVESPAAVGIICVAVEPMPGVDEHAIIARTTKAMSRYENTLVHVEARFPRTETGKIQRNLIRERVEAGLRRTLEPV